MLMLFTEREIRMGKIHIRGLASLGPYTQDQGHGFFPNGPTKNGKWLCSSVCLLFSAGEWKSQSANLKEESGRSNIL